MPFAKPRGIRLERKKDATLLNTLKRPYAPKRARVPLCAESALCVKEGDTVQPGQKIAHPKDPDGVPVYASIPGKIGRILPALMPDGRERLSVEILNDGETKAGPFPEIKKDAEKLSKEEIFNAFREQGLLSTGEKAEPVHARIRRSAPVKTVVINGCEPEPYVTSEQVLLTAHPIEVLKGAELLRKAAGAGKALFFIEDANREQFELIKSKIYLLKWDNFEVRMVPAVYPSGREDLLLKDLQGSAIAWNASTAYAAYEAVYLQKPFFERLVTVGGECVVEPRNLWLPIGFVFQDAVQACKGFLREPKKVLAGGPMTGRAQANLDVPVTAGTNAILALPPEVAKEANEQPCIRCNRCVDTCPVSISPAVITLAAEHAEFGIAEEWGVGDCVECGVCTYVCPSERPMADLIRLAKARRRA